jgi:alcohol dehydrogenase, propanol-preferring
MKAATLTSPQEIRKRPLRIGEVATPEPKPGQLLLRVRVCGVCRTDLHIVEGDLPPLRPGIIPGHQIVGEVVAGATADLPVGTRVGVSWMGGTDGTCRYCHLGLENLCDSPTFTGYTVDGGYAEYAVVRSDFAFPLPPQLDDLHAAPLLCAGIIGFRSLRVAGVKRGDRVGLFGFGASAHLAIAVLRAWNCEVYVSTRGATHRQLAKSLGAVWVGSETDKAPVELDCAITFAPSGDVVVTALASLRKGGVVAINAIHLDRIPQFDYDRLLWGERQIRSVANMTRADARDFLQLASEIGLRPQVTAFPLDQANEALLAVKEDSIDGAAAIILKNSCEEVVGRSCVRLSLAGACHQRPEQGRKYQSSRSNQVCGNAESQATTTGHLRQSVQGITASTRAVPRQRPVSERQ